MKLKTIKAVSREIVYIPKCDKKPLLEGIGSLNFESAILIARQMELGLSDSIDD